jgi:opacity protein-like surface antigen
MRNALLITSFLAASACLAGGDPLTVGARFAGMGGSGLTLADLWSVRLNPAGIAGLEAPVAGLFYQRHFLSEELAHQGLAVALPVGKGAFGLGVDRFGYSLYNETRASLAYAMRFGEGLRAAVQLNYLGVQLGGNYGGTSAFAAELGVQARISEQFWLGAHLYNPTRAKLGAVTDGDVTLDERVPTLLRAGLGWVVSSKLTLTGEVEKDIDRAERFRFGVEYNPSKALFLRTGISTANVQGHFGVGVRTGRLDVDLALAVRAQLGPTPMINLNYRFK